MRHSFVRFFRDEDAAVTVDWVVLTAGIMVLGIAVVLYVQRGAAESTEALGNEMTNAVVPTVVF